MTDRLQAPDRFAASMTDNGLTPPEYIVADGRIHRFSTNGKKNDTAGGYVLHLDPVPAGAFWDWRTGLYATWCATRPESLSPRERQLHDQRMAAHREQARRDKTAAMRKNSARIERLWSEARPIVEGDPVHAYLRGRGLILAQVPEVLRHHPALEYWDFDDDGQAVLRGKFPAMLAAVQVESFPDGRLNPSVLTTVALHRTYLTPDGRKADVPTPKKLTGTSGDMRGAAIRLAAPAFIEGAYRLGVAEGIETALAAAEGSGVPTWATVSAVGMKNFRWPPTPQDLYVFGDNDANETGQKAARDLERKANACGIRVHTLIPPTPGTDWADVWQAR